jgi:CRISPR type III-A-associated RAMP protein Csm4
MSLIEVKLRPTGPWRVGDRAGDRERVDVVYHSDALYSAVTHAMRALGWLEEWLDATARASGAPAVRFSSLFPFVGKTRLVSPPKSVWPPAIPGKLYLQGAKLVPLEIMKSGVVEEGRWQVDGESECLTPLGGSAPYRVSMRSAAAVDRLTGATEAHRTACLEFASNAGWWGVFEVADAAWEARVKSALRLLADSGFGGERSRGWGRASEPHFSEGSHLFGPAGGAASGLLWLLSLYSPHESDAVDWSRGEYSAVVRGGWTDSVAGTGAKKQVRMIGEGSVLAAAALRGQAVDVGPDGFPHPVYRSGFALAMPAPAEIVVRTVESSRPARVTPAKQAPVAPGDEAPSVSSGVTEALAEALAEPQVAAEPEAATEPDVVPEPFLLSEAETPEPAGEPEAGVVPVEELRVAEAEMEPEAEPGVSVEAAGMFVAEEPLVTPGDDAVSSGVAEAAAEALAEPQIAAEPEAATEPDLVPEPFLAAEAETPEPAGEPEAGIVPVEELRVAEAEMAPEAEPGVSVEAAGMFVAEEPLVTPGDDAVSAPEPEAEKLVKPDEGAE